MFLLRLLGLAGPKMRPIASMKEKEGTLNGFRFFAFPSGYRQYYCKDCGALNAVCVRCNVNHGCLPFFWDRP